MDSKLILGGLNRIRIVKFFLPPNGKWQILLALFYLQNKMKLLFFGTAKEYPIFAWLANFSIDIKNSNSEISEGRLMNWFFYTSKKENPF